MIVFDLQCSAGHRFEAWFASSGAYASQREAGLIVCPHCGTSEVSKAPMAPAVSPKGNSRALAVPGAAEASTQAPASAPLANRPVPAEVREALARLAEAQARALKGSTWVGEDFGAQARAMHYGEQDEAPIHGQASLAEARALVEEGVPIAPLPLPVTPPGKLN